MQDCTFGQFARVLVDMDLSQPLRYKVLVERKGFSFFVKIEYEMSQTFAMLVKSLAIMLTVAKSGIRKRSSSQTRKSL
jgi:hypothetical protein